MPKWEDCHPELHLDDEFRAIELISYTPDQTARMTVPLEDPPWPVPFGERFLSSVDYTWSKTIRTGKTLSVTWQASHGSSSDRASSHLKGLASFRWSALDGRGTGPTGDSWPLSTLEFLGAVSARPTPRQGMGRDIRGPFAAHSSCQAVCTARSTRRKLPP